MAPFGAVIRKLRCDEGERYRDFLLGLDARTRRDRFCGGVSDTYVAEHAARAWERALVHGAFVDGHLCGASELHLDAEDGVAEAAFVVDPALRKRGLGTALLDATVLAARNRGFRAVRVICLRDNWAMRRLAQKAEAALMLTFDEMHGEIRTPAATPLSLMREAVGDAFDATGRLIAPRAA